jgi:ligand-binding sensor domain-containing protein
MKKKKKKLFLLCLFSCKFLFADFFCKVKDFYPSEGFFQTLVSQYVQDDKGFIWLGTWNGLVRYDGYTFHEFRKVLTTNSLLPNSRIVVIQKSATGNLFCTTNDNRLYLFDMKTNCFIDVFLQINFNKKEVIKNLFSLKDGSTWVIFADGSCLRLQDDSYIANHNYYKASTFCAGAKVIKNVVQDNYKNEWIITDNGINIFNRHIRFHNISVEALHFSLRYACMAMANGRLAVYSYKGNMMHFISLPEKPTKFYQMKSCHSNIIMATDKGVIVYNQDNNAIRVYHLNSPNNPSDDALKVFTDSYNRIWVIPKLSGVYCIDLAHSTCDWFMSTPSKPMKYKLDAGFVYEEKDGNIIVKPNGGVLAYYDSNAHKLRDCVFYNEDGTMPYDPTILSYQFDSYGNLWLIQPQCLSCVSFIPKKFIYYTDKEKSITRALFIDPLKRLWVGDKDGAVYLLDQQHNIISYLNSKGTFQSSITHFAQKNVYCIYQDDKHRIWIGTKGCGLYLLTPKDNVYSAFKIQHFSSDKLRVYSLNSDDIYCIYQDNMHNVCIGTFGKGINLAREDMNGNFHFFNCDNKFKDYPRNDFSKVRCISQGYGGTILVGTDNGLLTFNPYNLNNPKFYRNTFNQNSEKSLKGDAVMSIIHVGKRIFLSAFGCGLCEIMSHDLLSNQIQFTTYFTPQNTSANLVNTAVCDNSSNIWLSSDYYIAQFSTKDNSYKIYD